MPTYTLEYTYDDRTEDRMSVRPDHLAYLQGLVHQGAMVAFGRYDDDDTPGALLIIDASDPDAVEEMAQHDPYMIAGLIPSHRIRSWPVNWGRISIKD